MIDLHIRQLQAAIREYQTEIQHLKSLRSEVAGRRRKKRRRPRQWDDATPMRDLISLEYDSQFKTMITQWKNYTDHEINPYKTSHFLFRLSDISKRAVYVPLARFLPEKGRRLRVSTMEFYRYLSAHSNLGSVNSIKTGLSRVRKWLQENAGPAK